MNQADYEREERAGIRDEPPKARPNGAAPATLPLREVSEIFAPLPAVPWLVQRLDICPGAPTLIAGYGFSGKTVAAQSFALTVAAGGRVWGELALSRRGRVVHLAYQQGFRLTAERYHRHPRAEGVDPADREGQLVLSTLPGVPLSAPKALDLYTRTAEGAALLIVDSLRASAPDIDENSSEVRRLLDLLTTVSERTGVVPLVIHHARKPREDDTGAGARMAIRGSGAIFDACSSVLVFSASKGESILVQHEKARTSGHLAPDFAIEILDAVDGAGLVVATANHEQRVEAARDARRDQLDAAVLDAIRRSPGCSLRYLRQDVSGKHDAIDVAIERLCRSRRVEERPGPRNARTFWASLQASS
ncbi:MAG: AAA family ATPase [Polyangiaceae bacterium]